MDDQLSVMSVEAVKLRILTLRGRRVLLAADLSAMYGVEARALTQAVSRNRERFPPDFMFQLTGAEWQSLRDGGLGTWGGRRTAPYAFTQEGVAMLSSVLRSERAVHVNIQIMRAFVKMRELLAAQADFATRLDELESRYDEQFTVVFTAIRQLMEPPDPPPKHPIGFRPADEP
jgi:hypothetical protein